MNIGMPSSGAANDVRCENTGHAHHRQKPECRCTWAYEHPADRPTSDDTSRTPNYRTATQKRRQWWLIPPAATRAGNDCVGRCSAGGPSVRLPLPAACHFLLLAWQLALTPPDANLPPPPRPPGHNNKKKNTPPTPTHPPTHTHCT
jgi:hypothetical protein